MDLHRSTYITLNCPTEHEMDYDMRERETEGLLFLTIMKHREITKLVKGAFFRVKWPKLPPPLT